MELIKDHLPEFNKAFVEEYNRIIAMAYQQNPHQAYEFSENFQRIPGLPIGFFIATDGITLLSPKYQNNQLKIVYNSVSWTFICQITTLDFDDFLKKHQIDLQLLKTKDCNQDLKWAQNEYRLSDCLTLLVVQLALIAFYESQGLDTKTAQIKVNQHIKKYA